MELKVSENPLRALPMVGGIHSMELKAASTGYAPRGVPIVMNPFNGIERKTQLDRLKLPSSRNPFNGIERGYTL